MKSVLVVFLLLIQFGFSQTNTHKLSLQKVFDTTYLKVKKYRALQNEPLMLDAGKQAIAIATKLQDFSLSAKTEIALGNFYFEKNQSDSTAYRFFHYAYNHYLKAKDTIKSAKTLLRLSIIEKNNNYLIKSKESLFLALEMLKGKQPDFLHELYNNLGIVFNRLGDTQKAIYYYQKSLDLRSKMQQLELLMQSYNNIATAYKYSKDYKRASDFYSRGLKLVASKTELSNEYARLVDNQAHLHLLLGKPNKQDLLHLKKALRIREQNQDLLGLITSSIHLAEFYQFQSVIDSSNYYAKIALSKSLTSQTYTDAIKSLDILIANFQGKKDYKKALAFAIERQELMNKKNQYEMAVGEKFADIRYEAGLKEKENDALRIKNQEQKINNQNQKIYLYFTLGTLVIALLGGLLYFNTIKLKNKQKELEHQQKEREAEKEIEKLLYAQQIYAERSKQKEQERISNDLHDSIAGKLSGIMLQVDNLSQRVPLDLRAKVDFLADYLSDIIQETHDIVQDLNQDRIIQMSFQTILEQLIQNQLPLSIKTTVIQKVDWDLISSSIKIAVYYIMQQALRNICEHANATHIWITLTQDGQQLQIKIKDNGRGFSSPKFNIGIPSMQKRAKGAGGCFSIESAINQGTVIHLNFPLL